MKKEIVSIDEKAGVFRVTTQDERWYTKLVFSKESSLPTLTYRPSVTWIADHYPKGIAFYKWLANHKNWDEAEAQKEEAGQKGSKVHNAIEMFIRGEKITHDMKFPNRQKDPDEEGNYPMERLSIEGWECLMSFVEFTKVYKPQFILSEYTVESNLYNFAGTLDAVMQIKDDFYLPDWKTSQAIFPHMEIQVSALKQGLRETKIPALEEALAKAGKTVEDIKLCILQVGYRANRPKVDGTRTMWKFTGVEDQFPLFLAARQIWQKENANKKPQQKDYPTELYIDYLQPKEEKVELVVPQQGEVVPPTKKSIKKPPKVK